jgi:predicted DNA-binding transcriptional regulator YafY
MRRADRLFQIVQLLRTRRLTTAAELAAELEVSTRTVYRDVQDLVECGVPIEGEAGVGYRLQKGYELRPMTFTVEELQALVLGARLVQAWADPELGVAVRGAMSKIESVLPEPLQAAMLKTALFGPPQRVRREGSETLLRLRQALLRERWAHLRYVDAKDAETERTVVPLGLYFWGEWWLLAGYCFLRGDYRTFRVDRVRELVSAEPNAARLVGLDPAPSLEGYVRAREACRAAELAGVQARSNTSSSASASPSTSTRGSPTSAIPSPASSS